MDKYILFPKEHNYSLFKVTKVLTHRSFSGSISGLVVAQASELPGRKRTSLATLSALSA